jgi:hypothetical protein
LVAVVSTQEDYIISDELRIIIENEAKHFPLKRTVNFLITLLILFSTSMVIGTKYQSGITDPIYGYLLLAIFIVYSLVSTYYNAKYLKYVHHIKKRDGYPYDRSDFKFDDNKTIIQVVFFCFIAGMLGGVTGIAGGLVLSPILL